MNVNVSFRRDDDLAYKCIDRFIESKFGPTWDEYVCGNLRVYEFEDVQKDQLRSLERRLAILSMKDMNTTIELTIEGHQ